MQIYKKDTKGKIRFLNIYTNGNILIQESGLLGSEKIVKHEKECNVKNNGKSNETKPEEQAIKQCNALLDKKLSEGYFKTIKEAEKEFVLLPMLAKDYKKEKHKINWNKPVYVQPKFDGMRCLAVIENGKVSLYSRKGKKIETMKHIEDELNNIEGDMVLDGELYCHGESFQENMKMIKKYRKGISEKIGYHVYDCISEDSFIKRRKEVSYKYCKYVRTNQIESEDDLKNLHLENIKLGYEGTMIRHGNNGYEVNKRSSQLLKYKDFIDKTYKVIDIVPSGANPLQGVVVCEGFKCGMKMSHSEREEILENKNEYIGQKAEVRFFEYTDNGLPRFPICWGFRNDK